MTDFKPSAPSRMPKVIVHHRALKDEFVEYGRGVRFTAFRAGIAENTLAKVLAGDVGDMNVRSLNRIADFFNLRLVIEFTDKRR